MYGIRWFLSWLDSPITSHHYYILPSQTKKSPFGLSQFMWSGWRESNPPVQLGKLAFYRWTTPAYSCIDDTILSALFPVFAKSYLGKRLVKSPATKRSCEEMNPHFFTAPFYFAFIWFRVQGSGFRVSESSLDRCFPFLQPVHEEWGEGGEDALFSNSYK